MAGAGRRGVAPVGSAPAARVAGSGTGTEATYTNLDAGHYRFLVRAANVEPRSIDDIPHLFYRERSRRAPYNSFAVGTAEIRATAPEGATHHHYNVATASGTWWRGALDAAGIAEILRIDAADVCEGARWIDTGSEQLIVPLASVEAVRRCAPIPRPQRGRANGTTRTSW